MKVRACRVLGHARALYNGAVSYGHHLLCHSERSRTKCGEVEESVLFTLFLGDGSFDSLRSLRMTVVVVTQLRRFEQCDKLKFEVVLHAAVLLFGGRSGFSMFFLHFRHKRL